MTWALRTGMGALLLGALCVATHSLHQGLIVRHAQLPQHQDARETLPSVEALQLMSLGYRSAVADLYWLRAVSHFGDRRMHRQLYPNLGPLLQRVVGLDPLFAGAYIFAGQALTFRGMDWNIPMALLKQGFAQRPDVWRIAFLLGFNAYYLQQDYALAAQALSAAAKQPGAPDFVGPLATRMAAEAGSPRLGLTLVETMLAGTADPKLRAIYGQRRALLASEVIQQELQEAVEAYRAQHQRTPASLSDLVTAGLRPDIPPDPLGGAYSLSAAGVVQSLHEHERLRLQPGALPPTHASD